MTITDGGNGRDRCDERFTVAVVKDSKLVHENMINLKGLSEKTVRLSMLPTCLLIGLWLPPLGPLVFHHVDNKLEHYENQCAGGQYARNFGQ